MYIKKGIVFSERADNWVWARSKTKALAGPGSKINKATIAVNRTIKSFFLDIDKMIIYLRRQAGNAFWQDAHYFKTSYFMLSGCAVSEIRAG